MKSLIVQRAFGAVAALVTLLAPRLACAQQMNFSYYTDIGVSSDQQTIYTAIDGQDNSTGCTHYDYRNTGYVYGPDGYYDEQYFPGLSSFIDVPFVDGSYYVSSSASVDCSCFGSNLGAGGGGDPVDAGRFVANYEYDGSVTMAGATVWRYSRCDAGICQKWYTPPDETPPPPFLRIPMAWTVVRNTRTCVSVLQQPIGSCSG